MKNNCLNCSNRVGLDWCTMQKDMNMSKYKRCKDHKVLPKKIKKIQKTTKKKITGILKDSEYSSRYMKFIKEGGFYSFVTKSYEP